MNIICFHNPNEENGYLSNWYLSNFVIDGITYTSVEQYMMHIKALTFSDLDIANKIMNTDDVNIIKSLGRSVSHYDDSIWSEIRGDSLLAECAVKDTI